VIDICLGLPKKKLAAGRRAKSRQRLPIAGAKIYFAVKFPFISAHAHQTWRKIDPTETNWAGN
jgi:hypothetical protein